MDSHVIADPYRNALSCLKLTTPSVGWSEQRALAFFDRIFQTRSSKIFGGPLSVSLASRRKGTRREALRRTQLAFATMIFQSRMLRNTRKACHNSSSPIAQDLYDGASV
jgi:hypothetical protein